MRISGSSEADVITRLNKIVQVSRVPKAGQRAQDDSDPSIGHDGMDVKACTEKDVIINNPA